ncbi:MAG: ATP-binding cassette domain-containing protein [Candidatus Eremiobacterota bacterium]
MSEEPRPTARLESEPSSDAPPRPRPEDDVVTPQPRPQDDVVPRQPRPEDDVVPRRPRPEDDVVPRSEAPCADGAVLDVRALSKRYGTVLAVNKLSMKLFPGDILGFLGPNGAGKTTTLRMLATVLAADGGDAYVAGHSLREVQEVRARVGYMPDFLGVYDDLLVKEYLEFFARAYKIAPHHRDFVIKEALETTRLTHLQENLVDGLSRGQKQRLGLARLLMHDPALFLLDEPAAGLDPRARVELRDILKGLQQRGKALIVSSHILSDLADFCNKVAILVHGNLLVFEETSRLIDKLRGSRRVRIRTLARGEELRTTLEATEHVRSVSWEGEELVLEFQGHDRELADLHRAVMDKGFPLITFAEDPWDLEDLYLQITEGVTLE